MAVQAQTFKPPPKAVAPPKVPKPLGRTALARLSPDDRLVLATLLEGPMEYVDDPALHERNAEATLFGGPTELLSRSATRFNEPEEVVTRPVNGTRIPTLTGEQERKLFLRYNYARMRVSQVQDRYAGKALTTAAARQLLAWGHRALDARSTLAQMNLPLVMAMAKRTRLVSVDYNELISEGNMALLRSLEKFDCGRGYKFSTYACRAILKSFSRVAMRMSRYRGRFPMEFDPAIERSDYLERKREEVTVDCVDELKEILLRNLADLTDVERTVIHERFALRSRTSENVLPKTLAQVGEIIGVTKERVRQIQNKALKKIKVTLEEKYLAA